MKPTEIFQAEDVNPEDVRKYVVFRDELNPKFWQDENTIHPLVRKQLLKASVAFYKFMDLPNLHVEDIIVCGSNASYNYTDLSDLDVHLIVDYKRAPCPSLIENFFTTKKTLWNTLHNVTVRGQDVEMYVQDTEVLVDSNGVFSILQNHWVVKPKAEKPSWDDIAVVTKTNALANEIDAVLDGNPTIEQIDDMLARIRVMRRSGLAAGGEFATENLAFKSLRNLGYMERLFKARNQLDDDGMSIR
jgi:hypothetical protein